MKSRRSIPILPGPIRSYPPGLLALLLTAAGGCDAPTTVSRPAPSVLSGTYSLFAMDGRPTQWFCTVWVDPAMRDALRKTDAYFVMYVNARLTFRPEAGEVDVQHRLVSCGGDETETLDVDLRGRFERNESLVRIIHSVGAASYTDTGWMRGDTLYINAIRIRLGIEQSGTALMAYLRDP